jgi:hypothetical protein
VTHPIPSEEEISALLGHRFPGGNYSVQHWENFLLTDCTESEQLPDQLVHPVALFHTGFLGSGTSIAEIFALGQAESDLSILIEGYDWEFDSPLREDVNYRVDGEITAAERLQNEQGKLYDRIQFRFTFQDGGIDVARSTITWHFTRNTL